MYIVVYNDVQRSEITKFFHFFFIQSLQPHS